jgi:hypothetical protein
VLRGRIAARRAAQQARLLSGVGPVSLGLLGKGPQTAGGAITTVVLGDRLIVLLGRPPPAG